MKTIEIKRTSIQESKNAKKYIEVEAGTLAVNDTVFYESKRGTQKFIVESFGQEFSRTAHPGDADYATAPRVQYAYLAN